MSNTALTSDRAQKWASNEQRGMSAASAAVAEAMAKGNQDYEAKMGFRWRPRARLARSALLAPLPRAAAPSPSASRANPSGSARGRRPRLHSA